MRRRERTLHEKKPPEWTWAEVCGFYRDTAGKAHMMTDKSVIEWARSYLAELRPGDPQYLERFLSNLADELRQRRERIDKGAPMSGESNA